MGLRRIDATVGREPMFSIGTTRAIEAEARSELPVHALMARAGASIARLAIALAPHRQEVRVFAGPGNNGGDGLDAALRLRAMGRDVTLVLCEPSPSPPADAADALLRARSAGVRMATIGDALAGGKSPGLVVDALLGIGASRPPIGDIGVAIDAIAGARASGSRVLSIDVPSGFDADRGHAFDGACVVADDTLTLLTVKAGLFTGTGRDHAGTVWFDSLGVDTSARPVDSWLVGRGDLARDVAPRRQAEHKGSFGDVAVVAGADGMAGAAILASRAAHAAGAGRVFVDLLGDGAVALTIDIERPELMLRHGWWRGPEATVSACTVVCGCGGGDAVRAALPRLLSLAPRLVLDADALNAIAGDSALQTQLVARAARSLQTVLTPHPLEAARLLGSRAADVQADRLRAATTLADRYRAVVALKGSGTIVAAPGSEPVVNATGNVSLATAGTGDVLAGWIGGRWRPGRAAFDVAVQGVIEHGAAADPERPGALRAADLVEALYCLARSPTG